MSLLIHPDKNIGNKLGVDWQRLYDVAPDKYTQLVVFILRTDECVKCEYINDPTGNKGCWWRSPSGQIWVVNPKDWWKYENWHP